jgi:hypothetical protein
MDTRTSTLERIINSLIIGLIAFVGALIGQGGAYPPDPSVIYTSIATGGLAFLLQLAYERGIKPFEQFGLFSKYDPSKDDDD